MSVNGGHSHKWLQLILRWTCKANKSSFELYVSPFRVLIIEDTCNNGLRGNHGMGTLFYDSQFNFDIILIMKVLYLSYHWLHNIKVYHIAIKNNIRHFFLYRNFKFLIFKREFLRRKVQSEQTLYDPLISIPYIFIK